MAVIDFTGGGTSQSDWDRSNGGQFAVLRDGSVVTGQLTDVGGIVAAQTVLQHAAVRIVTCSRIKSPRSFWPDRTTRSAPQHRRHALSRRASAS